MRCILLIFITRHTEYRKLLSLLCIFFIHGFNYLPVWRVCVLLTHLFIFLGSDIRRRCTLQDGYSTVICHNALLGSSKFRWRDLHRAFYIKKIRKVRSIKLSFFVKAISPIRIPQKHFKYKKYILSNSKSVQCNFFIFDHVTFTQFKICCCVYNFIEIG